MSSRVWTRCGAAWLSALVACSVGESDDGFGMLTGQPTASATSPMSGSNGSGGDDDDGSGSSAGTMADDDGGSADDGADGSSAGDDGGSSGQAASSDGSGSGGPANEQPESGMYSHCTMITDCVGTMYCITASPDDGFCTSNCGSPGVDCQSMPGGTAAPICLTVMQGTVCALDCSAGQTCPGGMICGAVEGMSVCV